MTATLQPMSCKVCSELQANIEAAARELSRAVNDAKVAIQPIAGIAAGNRIEDAQHVLRLADENFKAHQAICDQRSKSATSV
jgi:hypothetical protein